jgi:hypothetical protein
MIHKRLFLYSILILVHVAGLGGEQSSAQASQSRPGLRLWMLATDDNYQNARMVAFDVTERRISEEIEFPPDLTIISATWSPDGNYIGAVVGRILATPATTYGEKVCVFSDLGEEILCHEEPVLEIGGQLPFVVPAPIVWTADSQQLVFVTGAAFSQSEHNVRIVFLDVEQKAVSQSVEVIFPGIVHAWEWLGSSIQAGVIVKGSEPDPYQLYTVTLQAELSVEPLATYVTPAEYVYFVGNGHIAIRKRLENPDGHSVDVMRIEDGLLVPFQSLELVEYEETPLAVDRLMLSNNGELLAFTSWFETVSHEGSLIHLFVTDFKSGKTSLIGKIMYRIGQITWSPDDSLIATQICEGPGVYTQCHITVFSLDGAAITVDTGFPENRDPMWVALESQES